MTAKQLYEADVQAALFNGDMAFPHIYWKAMDYRGSAYQTFPVSWDDLKEEFKREYERRAKRRVSRRLKAGTSIVELQRLSDGYV